MAILAIDQGTSATKALVLGERGEVLGVGNAALAVRPFAGGAVEVDPEEMWASVLAAADEAISGAGVPIDAVGLGNQGETILAWDRVTGEPLGPGIVWQDSRSSSVCDRLVSDADEIAQLSGLTLDPYFVAPKMVWLREHVTTDGVVTTSDTWLLNRLCGAFVTDVSTASRSLLLDLDTLEWSPRLAEIFGLDLDTFPAVVSNAEVLGTTAQFGGQIPVAGACVDQQAALFAESCWSPGEMKCTYGTGAFLLATTGDRPVRSSSGLVACAAWTVNDRSTWCLDGQVFTAGSAVNWLVQTGLIDRPSDLDLLGGTVETSGGVSFVPALAGMGAPFWKPHAKGAFVGLGLESTRAHLVRSVIDGIAAQVAALADCAAQDSGLAVSALRVDGGLVASQVLCQTQADLLQTSVEVYPSPDATAIGVGAFTRLGIGHASTFDDAVPAWEPVRVFEPKISADEAEHRRAAWTEAAQATADLGASASAR